MRDPDRRIRRVDALPAGAARAERINAEILRVDVDVHLLGFGEDGDSRGRRVDAALRFRGGHALDAGGTAVVLQPAVGAPAFADGGGFLFAPPPPLPPGGG